MANSEETVVVSKRKLERVLRLVQEHGENLENGAKSLAKSIQKVDQVWEEVDERRRERRRRSG